MADDADLTEITAMEPDELHLVGAGANGFPQLLAKSLAAEVDEELAKATWSTAMVNNFPDSSFAYIEPGGTKDADGKTTPRSLRHFPIRDADGKADAPHVRNALARADQSPFGSKAMPKIKAAAKEAGIELAKEAAMVKCPTCKGKKTIHEGNQECPTCKGKGDVTQAAAEKLAKDDGTTVNQADPTIPGSQAWETHDAEALIAAGQMLANAASMLNESANRERIEVATGHADDMGDVYDLSDAVYAVQNALSIVARVAFTEEAEAQAAGALAKSSLRSPQTADAIRKVLGELSLLAKATDPGGAAVGQQKGADMALEINTEELGALIKSGVEEALPAAVEAALLAKSEADKAAADATKASGAPVSASGDAAADEVLAKQLGDLETANALPDADSPVGKLLKEAADRHGARLKELAEAGWTAEGPPASAPRALNAEDLIKSMTEANKAAVTEAVEAAVSPLQAQVEELSKAARPGGPRVSVPGTGRIDAGATGEVDITALEEEFSKSVDGSYEKAALGERITKMKLLAAQGIPVKSTT